jgi:hypothetical protein
MKQLIDILNLNMATTFNQLNIGRATEMLLLLSILNSFSYYQNNSKIAFKSEELDFFNPELPEKYSTDDLIHLSKNTIYKSVHLFIERIRNVVKIKISTIYRLTYLYIYEKLP